MPEHTGPPARLGALFGTGRSGSTWLGTILASHPDVAYRFEPFHRLKHRPELGELKDLLERREFSHEQLRRLYEVLWPSDPAVDKPPFVDCGGTMGRLVKTLLWSCSRKIGWMSPVFRWAYTPSGPRVVLFKEVTCTLYARHLLLDTDMPMVYLVRHPCAVVASLVDGQSRGLMPVGRLEVLDSLLQNGPPWADKYVGRTNELNPYQKNALLWRLDVEEVLAETMQRQNLKVIFYESLCRDPYKWTAESLGHFGLDYPKSVEQFVESTTRSISQATLGERLINRYFSVRRDPRAAMNKWKTILSDESIRDILAIVSPSFIYEIGCDRGGWDEIS